MNNTAPLGYAPGWIADKVREPSRLHKAKAWFLNMSTPKENGWTIVKLVTQVVLGVLLTALAGSAAYTAKTLTNHESRIAVVEEWKRDRSAVMDQITREFQELKTRNAINQEQARATDAIVREAAARLGVMSDTLIRMQEGQSAIKEKMVSIQIMTDELNKGKE